MEGVVHGAVDANGYAHVPVAFVRQLIFEHKQLQEQVATLTQEVLQSGGGNASQQQQLQSPFAFAGGFKIA